MAKVICSAVTCMHNAGNVNGTYPVLGIFDCLASHLEFGDTEGKCDGCKVGFNTMDCLTYDRFSAEEMRKALDEL